jgi:hypothetical protein
MKTRRPGWVNPSLRRASLVWRRAWAHEYGVICLGGASTFYTIDGADQPPFWPQDALRAALAPSGARPRLSDQRAHAQPSNCHLLRAPLEGYWAEETGWHAPGRMKSYKWQPPCMW